MPILAMDQFGRFYEASPDRSDGRGFKTYATPSERKDLTLGNDYLKSECDQRNQVLREKQSYAEQDMQDAMEKRAQMAKVARMRRRDMAEEELMANQLYRMNRINQAIQMGHPCKCDSTTLSGNGLTHNGLSGVAGMNETERKVYAATSGRGLGIIPQVDPIELHQHQMRQLVARQAMGAAIVGKAKLAVEKRSEEVEKARRKMTNLPAQMSHPYFSKLSR